MLIIGDKEVEAKAVGVRSRKDGDIGQMSTEDFINKIKEEERTFAKQNKKKNTKKVKLGEKGVRPLFHRKLKY